MVVFLFLSLRNTDGTVIQGANSDLGQLFEDGDRHAIFGLNLLVASQAWVHLMSRIKYVVQKR